MNINLTLYFTDSVSLKTWEEVGILEREAALYQAMVGRGVGVDFVTYGDETDLVLGSRLPGIRIRTNRWKLPMAWYRRSIVWGLGKDPNQVVKSNQIPGALVAQQAARRAKAPFIARCGYWWADFAERRYGIDSDQADEARQIERQVFRSADVTLVTADWIKSGIVNRYGIDEKSVRVIPNYVQTDLFLPDHANPKADTFRIIYIGRLAPEKNLFALIEAMSRIDGELIIIGEGPECDRLKGHAKLLSAPVTFLGRIPNRDIPRLLNQSHAFVLPSFHEGQPKALQEAMSCGLPVVGCDVVGVRDLIQHEQTGLLTESSAEALRVALQRLMDDDNLRGRLGENAHQFVINNFSLDLVVEQELDVYKELIY